MLHNPVLGEGFCKDFFALHPEFSPILHVKKGGKIISKTTLSGKTFTGKIFIDATYEVDLMAATGVSYHVGLEANSVYNEIWNGM